MSTVDKPDRPTRLQGTSEGARFAVVSSKGKRFQNEDSWAVNPAYELFAVIDGMGGPGCSGRPAAEILAASLEGIKLSRPTEIEPVRDAASRAGDQIRKFGEDNPFYRAISCEFAAIRLSADNVVIAHVGLARVYRLLPAGVEQLTLDHSLEAVLLRQGKPEKAGFYGNVSVRAIGVSDDGADAERVEVALLPRASGNRFLLATDGLWEVVREHEIEAALRSTLASATECCESLVTLASKSKDNVTAMVVDLL